MKQQIVPTSPKSTERHEHHQKKNAAHQKSHPHLVFAVIVTVLFFGAVSGFFGFIIAFNIPSDFPVLGRLNVLSLFQQERDTLLLSSRGAEKSVVNQAPYTIEQIASLYSAKPTIEEPADFYGNAVILTADGWMALATAALSTEEKKDTSLVVVLPNAETREVKQRIDDALTGVTYIKVDAQELSVVNFDEELNIPTGKQFSLIEKHIGSYVVYARRAAGEKNIMATVRSTQHLEQLTVIDEDAHVHALSSPIFYNTGEFAGIVIEPGVILHSSYIKGALDSVINTGSVEHSPLDVEYINISRLTDDEKRENNLPDVGILITNVRTPKISQLEVGDAILSVNNKPVDENTDFTALVHSRPAGSSLYMTILRDGTEQTFAVKL